MTEEAPIRLKQSILYYANLALALLFVVMLVLTFLLRPYIDRKARAFAIEASVQHATPMMDHADDVLGHDLTQEHFTEEALLAVRQEVDRYRLDPHAYVAELLEADVRLTPDQIDSPYADDAFAIKLAIRHHYDYMFDQLVRDLRIFTATNIFFALLAAWLARIRFRSESRGAVLSMVLLAALVYNSWLYIDANWFFRIIFGAYLGFTYPVLLTISTLLIYRNWSGTIRGVFKELDRGVVPEEDA